MTLRSMSVSIIELSKVAGVSKSTVSRVLNHDPRVSPSAVRAVRTAIERMGYARPVNVGRPRRADAGIRKGAVALLIPDQSPAALKTVLSGRLLHGIEEAFRSRGLTLIVTGLPEGGRLPQSIAQGQVDGVIMRGMTLDRAKLSMLAEMGDAPCVYLFEPRGVLPPNWDIVLEDNDAIAEVAAKWLIGRGATNLLCANGLPGHPSLRHRAQAFERLVSGPGKSASFHSVEAPMPIGPAVAEAVRVSKRPIDGVFVPGGDDQAVDVYRSLVAAGVRPGPECPFICCYNDPLRLATLDPALPNIDIQAEAIGRAAAEMLLWRLQNPKHPRRRMTVAPRLVESPTS